MSHGPGLFHAYFIGVGDTTNWNYSQNSSLYLVTFSSRNEADKWWRATQLSPDTPKFLRFTPQFIMAPLPNIQDGWECIIQTLKVKFDLRKAIAAAPDSRTDHLNGREYCIRSATSPNRFWVLDGTSIRAPDIITHHTQSNYLSPTRFIINSLNPMPHECRQEENVLIGGDEVEIIALPSIMGWKPTKLILAPVTSLPPHPNNVIEFEGLLLSTMPDDNIPNPEPPSTFNFSWFENGFYLCFSLSHLANPSYVAMIPDSNERWELVR